MSKSRGQNEGSIAERTDGRWMGRVTLPGGRRKAFYGKTRAEVAKAINKALTELEQGITPADGRMTVQTFLDRWLEQTAKPKVRWATYRGYEQLVRGHLVPELGKIRLSKLTADDVEAFVNRKVESGLSPRTVQYAHAVLRVALQTAVRRRYVHQNVAALVGAPKVTREPVEPLTVELAQVFLKAAQGDRFEALYTVTLALGLRRGEVLGLRWADVDLEDGRLWVRWALQRQKDKGLVMVEPKSRTSRRAIPLPPFVTTTLKEHRRRQNELRLMRGPEWQDLDYVFTMDDGRPVSPDYLTQAFPQFLAANLNRCPKCKVWLPANKVVEGLCKECGTEVEPRKLRFHDLRHSCASLLFAQGCSMRLVMEILGHSQIALTMNTYTHLLPEADREAATAMQSLFGAGS